MAICKRNNCSSNIGGSVEEQKLRLCATHYKTRERNKFRRNARKQARCQYIPCGKLLVGTRNKSFCCQACRDKSRRIIDDDLIVKMVTHSWWLNIEAMIKNNPFGLGSIRGPEDIANMIRLYDIKARHQNTYNVLCGDWVQNKEGFPLQRPRPWLELELSHRYPNSRGGANHAQNIIIAPKVLNRMLKDSLPHQDQLSAYNGLRATGDHILVKKTLLKALADRYGQKAVKEALAPVKNISLIKINTPRKLVGISVLSRPPLLDLLIKETLRLGLYNLKEAVTLLGEYMNMLSDGLDNELLAAACFHSLLCGDPDGLLNSLAFLPAFLSKERALPPGIKSPELTDIYAWYTQKLRIYMQCHFRVDMNDRKAGIQFYSRFFTVPPFDQNGLPIEINLMGQQHHLITYGNSHGSDRSLQAQTPIQQNRPRPTFF